MACKITKPYINLQGLREIKTASNESLVELDGEWVELIIEAKNMGMKLEDVMDFLESRMKDGIQRNGEWLSLGVKDNEWDSYR